jgi:hypothetical protein
MKQLFITSLLALLLTGAAASAQAPSLRVALQGGYGYRLGKISETGEAVVDQHNQRLKWGFTVRGGCDLVLRRFLWIGTQVQ